MNGRLYDPVVGRFLNVDPYIQNPGYTQNYNRYSYCLNNPLKYVDLTGETQGDFWLGEDGGGGGGVGGGGFRGGDAYNPRFWERTWEINANHGNYNSPSGGGNHGESEAGSPGQGGSGISLPTNTVLSSIYFGVKNGVYGIWYQTSYTTGDAKSFIAGSNSSDFQSYVINRFTSFRDNDWYNKSSGRCNEDYTIETFIFGTIKGARSIISLMDFLGKIFSDSKVATTPKPSPNFRTPTNPAQNPPSSVPEGLNLRVMNPTEQYPNGYWILEKPMPQGGVKE